jgi:hypothetical protein
LENTEPQNKQAGLLRLKIYLRAKNGIRGWYIKKNDGTKLFAGTSNLLNINKGSVTIKKTAAFITALTIICVFMGAKLNAFDSYNNRASVKTMFSAAGFSILNHFDSKILKKHWHKPIAQEKQISDIVSKKVLDSGSFSEINVNNFFVCRLFYGGNCRTAMPLGLLNIFILKSRK